MWTTNVYAYANVGMTLNNNEPNNARSWSVTQHIKFFQENFYNFTREIIADLSKIISSQQNLLDVSTEFRQKLIWIIWWSLGLYI